MSRITFDTSFIIANKLSEFPDNFLLSEVVLLELTASAADETIFKSYQALRKVYEENNLLIKANSDDWLMASKILYWLEQGKRKENLGKAPAKRPGATQKMALDALIAVTVRRYRVTVVTENWNDFNAIKYYCDFKLIKGADFLNR